MLENTPPSGFARIAAVVVGDQNRKTMQAFGIVARFGDFVDNHAAPPALATVVR